jgi:hypothetical protein
MEAPWQKVVQKFLKELINPRSIVWPLRPPFFALKPGFLATSHEQHNKSLKLLGVSFSYCKPNQVDVLKLLLVGLLLIFCLVGCTVTSHSKQV